MNKNLNDKATLNFINIKVRHLILPVLLLMGITLFIFQKEKSFSTIGYIDIQAGSFFYLNELLSKMPILQYNLTQFGDALVSYSLLTIFIIYAPKLWEVLLTSSIISLIVSALLKKIFAVPRPAAIFDNDSFIIIGKTLAGSTSLPSGHSMTTFMVISILFFVFTPPRNNYAKVFLAIFCLIIGLLIAFTRVGVGAHYPIDVIVGSIIAYMITIVGILINNKTNYWGWIKKRKFLPVFMLVFVISIGIIIKKITETNLFIYYLPLLSIIITLFLTIKTYVQKEY
ncbi:MAG: membrane-associated phospholipid phosphatase [Polaribacter sp.]|jgi:membrane-associated phospholipid phosphatase